MATVPYIVLRDSTSGSGNWFRVIQGGYSVQKRRQQTINLTVDGGYDISQGANYETHKYMIRVREEEPITSGSPYGTLADLETLWLLNNPNGSPSDKITMTDHFGVEHLVMFEGEFDREAVTTLLSGQQAWFFVPITLRLLT